MLNCLHSSSDKLYMSAVKPVLFFIALCFLSAATHGQEAPEAPLQTEDSLDAPPDEYVPPELFTDVYRDDLYAIIRTSEGDMKFHLHGRTTPNNVMNFVNLARGAKEHIDLAGARSFRRFYDGLTFHKVHKDFVVQGGCPRGNGRGGPGYSIPDEISERVINIEQGILGMANHGRDTNGSQFFITTGLHPQLHRTYTILGQITEGVEVLQRINNHVVDGLSRPVYPIVIERIDILVGDQVI